MEELIKNNSGFIEEILKDNLKISKKLLTNMIQISSLKEDFEKINFSLDDRNLFWDANICLKNRINSAEEFRKYLQKNKISLKDISGYGDEIYRPDYILVMDYGVKQSELRCNFYNPNKLMFQQKQ